MKADVNTLTNMFWDCNRKYFDNSLPTPYIELFDRPNIVARFEYGFNVNAKNIDCLRFFFLLIIHRWNCFRNLFAKIEKKIIILSLITFFNQK